ncbi:MAG: sialidase family protein [Terriglobia bacterium]
MPAILPNRFSASNTFCGVWVWLVLTSNVLKAGFRRGAPSRGLGRILLSYGVREQDHQGIAVRVSGDEGGTWSAPTWIVHLEGTTDGGYPSTVQLPDGVLVTAYYSNGIPQHQRYHMGVVRWSAEH